MSSASQDSLRKLNEHKREFLAQKFGMRQSKAAQALSPEDEARHLDTIAEIELACATAGEVTVREYLGNPQFKQMTDTTPSELRSELTKMESLLQANNIMFIPVLELGDAEKYRVLVNELLDQKIENVRFPIWYTVFMYIPFLGFKRFGVSMSLAGPGRKGGSWMPSILEKILGR